jgi:hypothetical protein
MKSCHKCIDPKLATTLVTKVATEAEYHSKIFLGGLEGNALRYTASCGQAAANSNVLKKAL